MINNNIWNYIKTKNIFKFNFKIINFQYHFMVSVSLCICIWNFFNDFKIQSSSNNLFHDFWHFLHWYMQDRTTCYNDNISTIYLHHYSVQHPAMPAMNHSITHSNKRRWILYTIKLKPRSTIFFFVSCSIFLLICSFVRIS